MFQCTRAPLPRARSLSQQLRRLGQLWKTGCRLSKAARETVAVFGGTVSFLSRTRLRLLTAAATAINRILARKIYADLGVELVSCHSSKVG